MSIRERLVAEARRLRERPCPADACPACYRHACRTLTIGHCICTGHITQLMKNFYPR